MAGQDEPRNDTLRVLLASSQDRLAEVQTVLDKGRITREERALKSEGPWCVGLLYATEKVKINMVVASLSPHSSKPVTSRSRTTYIGVLGCAHLTVGTFHKQIQPGVTAYVDPEQEHMLEPIDVGCQILQILVSTK